jgi:hypothetical protein
MLNRFRQFIESIVFAGLQPKKKTGEAAPAGKMARFRAAMEKFVSGDAPKDKLYLSNRSWGQRLRLVAVIALPCLLLAGVMIVALSGVFKPKTAPPRELSVAEILNKVLPNLGKDLKLDTNTDAEIDSIFVTRGGERRLVGVLKNKTDRTLKVELNIAFTDENVSNVGSDIFTLEKVPPRQSYSFSFPMKVNGAIYAIVRTIRTLE